MKTLPTEHVEAGPQLATGELVVSVLLFASYAEAMGRSALDLTLPIGATVGDLLERVAAFPGGDRVPPSPLVAVNESYASRDQRLEPGDEVALIPPVAGG